MHHLTLRTRSLEFKLCYQESLSASLRYSGLLPPPYRVSSAKDQAQPLLPTTLGGAYIAKGNPGWVKGTRTVRT
jgi:hypothetical protein